MIGSLSVKDITAPAHVHRWHMIRVKRTQTLAEHSFTVALLAAKLASLLDFQTGYGDLVPSLQNILETALLHDFQEIEFGDMPTPAKWFMKASHEGKSLLSGMEQVFWQKRGVELPLAYSPDVEHVVKLADMIEAYLFYREEGDDPAIRKRLKDDMMGYATTNFKGQNRLLAFIFKELP